MQVRIARALLLVAAAGCIEVQEPHAVAGAGAGGSSASPSGPNAAGSSGGGAGGSSSAGSGGAGGSQNSPPTPRNLYPGFSEPTPSPLLEAAYQALPPEGVPLLERASDHSVNCRVQRAPEISAEQERVAVAGPDGTRLVFTDTERQGLFAAPLDLLARAGASDVIDDRDGRFLDVKALAGAQRTTLAWTRDWTDAADPEQLVRDDLTLAQLNERGQPLEAPHLLQAASIAQYGAQLVALAAGFAVFWTERDNYGGPYALRFARLDANAQLLGTPLTLLEQADQQPVLSTSLNTLGDGFVASWRGEQPSNGYAGYLSSILDAEGNPVGAPLHLGADYWSATLQRGDRILAAWNVGYVGPPTPTTLRLGGDKAGAHTLRIGWFDLQGKPLGSSLELQAPSSDRENTAPAWIDLGDNVGLVWSHGTEIYICGGCVPDHELNFVVLDGNTLQPKSELLHVTNPGTSGGLLNARLAPLGRDLLLLAERRFHTTYEAFSAILRCEAANP